MHPTTTKHLAEFEYLFFDDAAMRNFITYLQTRAEVIAPHVKGERSFAYKTVRDAQDVVLNYPRTIQPLKKYFLPPSETLLQFNRTDNQFLKQKAEARPRIFFGIHSYEMQAVFRLDYSFKRGNPESNYLTRRDNALFIGISYKPDSYHFGKSVGIEIEQTAGFCLFIEPTEMGYFMFIIDEQGRSLLDGFGASTPAKPEFKQKEKEFHNKIKFHHNRLPEIFEHAYHSDVWKKVSEKCLGCGTCNLLCPTCYCFDVRDEIELDVEHGVRQRFWDGCMLHDFTRVAGNEVFRDKLHNRTRHRLFRKFKYITDHSGELSCVGCGRCSAFCPAKISIVEIINHLIADVSEVKSM